MRERAAVAAHLRGVGKRYGDRWVLREVDLDVVGGTVTGLVGPNGAGKSTLLRILAGLISPSEGHGSVLGHTIAPKKLPAPVVGLMAESPAFIEHFSAVGNLRSLAAVLGTVEAGAIRCVLSEVGLDPDDRRPVRSYSQGMRQRLSLAQAIMERPLLLILDEPTNGLDPVGIVEMRGMVRRLAEQGAAIILASHLLSEVEAVADSVVMLVDGRLSAASPSVHPDGVSRVAIRVSAPVDVMAVLTVPGVNPVHIFGTALELEVACGVPELVRRLVAAGTAVEAVEPVRRRLEQDYLSRVGRLS